MDKIAMDQDSRDRLIRVETTLLDQTRRIERVIEISENIARIQERETDRDDKIKRLFSKGETAEKRLDSAERTLNYARGVIGIICVVMMPVIGYVLDLAFHETALLERRLLLVEAHAVKAPSQKTE